ncbi:hypothetical protein HZS55_02065 [Halosimplex rubrum]|uniref:Uncharacterized protein n=1 Tax=Halosimplex rubrum TaxID=869889 RepID=A0A7D5P0M6_9EURY|nr:DUF5810 domain-containing protein [Halosimplex rubrum]QLH76161.1 hypothetical protein HZS55_02065 [Halosimplex rubrum]
MGYACPVCGDPQTDAEHLANHLAFTAMLRGGDHEAWLDDRVDDWAEMDPPDLAERVVDHADEAEFPQVFEDTTGGDHDSGHGHDHGHQHGGGNRGDGRGPGAADAVENAAPGGVADLDEFEGETDDVLAEAKELTRRRRENAGDDGSGDGATDDGDAADAADADADGDETGDS